MAHTGHCCNWPVGHSMPAPDPGGGEGCAGKGTTGLLKKAGLLWAGKRQKVPWVNSVSDLHGTKEGRVWIGSKEGGRSLS